jgi:3-ketosteroid 9alpha-monooxygenase subunit A
MTDRFELEVDTTKANEKWHVEVEENLRRKAAEGEDVAKAGKAGQPAS